MTATYPGAVRSEWVKFRSLRSLAWTTLSLVLLMVGLGALFSFGRGREVGTAAPADQAGFDPTLTSLSGILLAQIAVAVLGVLVITSEFASGTIRPSLVGVPWRSRLLGAKAVMLTSVAFTVGAVAGLAAFLLGQPIISGQNAPSAGLGDAGVLRAVLGTGLYLGATALLGLALGALIRSTAGALTIVIVVMLTVPVFSSLLPQAAAEWVTKWWPSLAGMQILAVVQDPDGLTPWQGLGVLAGFAAVVLAAAFVVFRRRDV
ncbi:ABC transporter permease [Actinoplanes sp. GCM10030250]|uniref:ABC transporter permease n=1 Tax=Actinoplanes sp. GCM10030250 TaxID=3273376 RepID=UPI00360C99FA